MEITTYSVIQFFIWLTVSITIVIVIFFIYYNNKDEKEDLDQTNNSMSNSLIKGDKSYKSETHCNFSESCCGNNLK